MENDFAKNLMAEVVKLSDQLNLIAHSVEEIQDEAERTEMRRNIAAMFVAADAHLYRPIVKQFPELDPHFKRT